MPAERRWESRFGQRLDGAKTTGGSRGNEGRWLGLAPRSVPAAASEIRVESGAEKADSDAASRPGTKRAR